MRLPGGLQVVSWAIRIVGPAKLGCRYMDVDIANKTLRYDTLLNIHFNRLIIIIIVTCRYDWSKTNINYHNCSVLAKPKFGIKFVSDFGVLTATQEEEPLSREQLQVSEVVCFIGCVQPLTITTSAVFRHKLQGLSVDLCKQRLQNLLMRKCSSVT